MNEIVVQIKRVTDLVGEITVAAVEQSGGIEQVNEAVTGMDRVTQQNAALVEEAAAASESIAEQAAPPTIEPVIVPIRPMVPVGAMVVTVALRSARNPSAFQVLRANIGNEPRVSPNCADAARARSEIRREISTPSASAASES